MILLKNAVEENQLPHFFVLYIYFVMLNVVEVSHGGEAIFKPFNYISQL